MKQIFKFAAVVFAAMLLTNCVKENLEPTYTPVQLGDAIQFGSRAGFASNDADSRTVYTGKTYTYNDVTYEGIDWVINEDMIDIYSPDVDQTGSTNVMYRVTGATTGQESTDTEGNVTDHTRDYATLTPVYEGDAMKWGGNTTHTFYAMYPTAFEFNETVDGNLVTLEQGVKLDKTTMKGIIPSSYTPEVTLQGNTYVATPNMRYAYMVAKTEHDPSTKENMAAGNKVGLSFVPVVTAVEIELLFPDDQTEQEYYDIYVGSIILSSEKQKLSGGFTADLSAWNPSSSATPVCQLDETVTSQNYVQISTLMFNSTTGIEEPIKLTKGQSIKVTAFLLPHTDIEDLTVGFTQGAATPKEKSLAAAGTIPAKVKTRITKVKLPVTAIPDDPQESDPGLNDASNWMRDLVERKPNITMAGLSLPGTGGSFTYISSQGTSYRQQYKSGEAEMYSGTTRDAAMTFDKQWALGIRAFEIVSDRPSYTEDATLYTEPITCNQVDLGSGYTVGWAFDQIITKIKAYPEETAVVILVYQPEGNTIGRNADCYAQALENMITKLETDNNAADGSDIFKLYTPDMTLAEAAGHILVMARINQVDEGETTGTGGNLGNTSIDDKNTNWTNAKAAIGKLPIILIDGCGTAKDRWGARGYKLDDALFAHISNNVASSHLTGKNPNIIESYMQQGSYLYGNTGSYNSTSGVVTYPSGSVTKTISSKVLGNTLWSETHTVVRPGPTETDALTFGYESYTGASTSTFTVWYQEWARVVAAQTVGDDDTYWFESYYEKLNHVLRTFDMAIDNVHTDHIYVNSLCGYLVDASVNTSSDQPSTGNTYGGSGGDIQGLAKKLTPQFYQYVLKRAQDNTTGPTGVVMMDYVSDNPDEGGSHYLPSLIIANNLKSSSN